MRLKLLKIIILLLITATTYKAFAFFSSSDTEMDFTNIDKSVILNDNGLIFSLTTQANTVSDFLAEKNIKMESHDIVSPSLNSTIYPQANIAIKRALKIKIKVDGKTIEGYTLANNIRDAVIENKVVLNRLDKTTPDLNELPQNNLTIVVTRINVEEVVIPEDIDFKTVTKTDNKLGWREKKIEQKGEKGIKEVKYKITYKDGKEISRLILDKNTTKDPLSQIEIQGTYVKIGKSHKGQGTWYSFRGGLYAASPWLPMGSYAKVTNTANGKSVMVEINDRGPFGDGRIIDLDKEAFKKIAPLGAGVIGVKVEEVLN